MNFSDPGLVSDPMANETFKKLQAGAQALLDERAMVRQDDARTPALQRFVHFWLLVGRGFVRNRCPVRASALAYTTLLALVPLLAVVVSVSTSLLRNSLNKPGEANPIENMIGMLVANVAPQLDLVQKTGGADDGSGRQEVVKKISEYIGNIHSGALGATGTVALVFVAIMLLSTIEVAFNDIWGVTRGRSWTARVVNYWAAITLGPLVLILAIAVSTGPHLTATRAVLGRLPFVGELFFYFLPFLILSAGFTLFYQLMPNTRVHWRAALVGGVVGGCLWQLNNLFNIIYVSSVVKYVDIYGSLGVVPVFLIGMYFSWLIVLFGAQVAYAFQNRRAYVQEKLAESVSQRDREFVALRVMSTVARRFQMGAKPPTGSELAEALGVPTRLVSQVVQALIPAGLVVEVAGAETGYAPARPLAEITAQDIFHALRTGHGQALATRDDPERLVAQSAFDNIQQVERSAASAVTLQALVEKQRS
ncbi:MAG: YihY family inner membrane protein [Verrucomicrobia bacterium]|nr:YihY family inner membrane protein [Verrucomicrobiota bacterium]